MFPGAVIFQTWHERERFTPTNTVALATLLWMFAGVYSTLFETWAIPRLRACLLPVMARVLEWGSLHVLPWIDHWLTQVHVTSLGWLRRIHAHRSYSTVSVAPCNELDI